MDLVLDLLDALLLEPLRFGWEVVKQFYETRSEEFLYVPLEEYEGVANIKRALNSNGDIGNKVSLDVDIQSKKYILKILSDEKKENYLKDYRFYNQMKTQECFINSRNFSNMSISNKKKLMSFSYQLAGWEKFLLFAVVAQTNIPSDIFNVIYRNWVDLSPTIRMKLKIIKLILA
ncbi:MAG: hypothetical protein H0T84_14530 [Tatlockia sp.]|nr:hypothetical protein [Tatlockia sp.]